MLFCSLINGISSKICLLCFVLLNRVLLNLLCVWIVFIKYKILSVETILSTYMHTHAGTHPPTPAYWLYKAQFTYNWKQPETRHTSVWLTTKQTDHQRHTTSFVSYSRSWTNPPLPWPSFLGLSKQSKWYLFTVCIFNFLAQVKSLHKM